MNPIRGGARSSGGEATHTRTHTLSDTHTHTENTN